MSEKKESLFENLFSFLFKTKKGKSAKKQKELQKHYKHVQPKHVEKEKNLFI